MFRYPRAFAAVIAAVSIRAWIGWMLALIVAGCATPPPAPSGPSPDEIAKQQRLERANLNFNDGLKRYDAGEYGEAMKSFLLALDSGLLTTPQQIASRKTMAFIHCVSSREANCREEFEKAFALDPKFDLTAAETGHPSWGPVFRDIKNAIEAKRSGRSAPPGKAPTEGEKRLAEATAAYEEADYAKAVKLFQDAQKETLTADDKIRAMKFTAFSHCLTNRMTLCRQEFEKILKEQPDFDLTPAEAGHPSWGPSFRAVKARLKAPAKK